MDDGGDISTNSKLATEIILAYLSNRSVEPEDLPNLVLYVRQALAADLRTAGENNSKFEPTVVAPRAEAPDAGDGTVLGLIPAVPIENSVTKSYIVSLEDGRRFRSLTRHLKSKYGMAPDQYRERWGLAPDYPMVAEDYSKARSELAKRHGLGRRKRA